QGGAAAHLLVARPAGAGGVVQGGVEGPQLADAGDHGARHARASCGRGEGGRGEGAGGTGQSRRTGVIGTRTPRSWATPSAREYPASTWRITRMAASLVSRRSSFCRARSVPSARPTWPAWIERPMPTPPPWWIETQVAPELVEVRA